MWDLMIGLFFTLLSVLLVIWAVIDLVRTRHWQYIVPAIMYLLTGLFIGLRFLHIIQMDTMACVSSLVMLLVGILLHRILQRADRRPTETR